jgi:PPOX class probable F420-dependent enzyme
VSRRGQIRMDAAELAAFLDEQRTLICATLGRDGWPHLMPLWYVMESSHPPQTWAWTYAKSQKVRNLERDPRATIQVEAGTEYGELRGMMARTECEIVRDLDEIAAIGTRLAERYGGGALTPEQEAGMRRQAAKRVGLRFHVRDVTTWDHRKLGGTY